jgi:RND family efflux transporter MFP subunit
MTQEPETPPKAVARTGGRRVLWLAIIVVLILAAAAYWRFYGASLDGSGAAAAAPPPTVTVSKPLQKEIVEWDEYTGQFAAVDYVEVRARVGGYLDSVNFKDGQMVAKGDLLFVIDPRPFEIALASAKAQVGETTARLDLANRQLGRAGQLRQNDFMSAATFDQRNAETRGAASAVESARAAVRQAELNLVFTQVTAPLGGRTSRHMVSVGNLVNGGDTGTGTTTLLTTIVSLDPIYFYFDMSEAQYLAYQRAVAAGKLKSTRDNEVEVSAHLVDEKDWPHPGRMSFVDNQVDRGAGTIRARAQFANPGFFITPGQFARIRVPGSEPYQAILIPDSALVTDQSRKQVLVVKDDGTVEARIVRPGPSYEGLRIIRKGLAASDRIIINGLMRARPGAKVTPQPGSIEPEPSS